MDKYEMLRAGIWSHYINDDIAARLMACEEKCFEFNTLPPSRLVERRAIIESLLGGIRQPFTIHSPFHCDFGFNIRIGSGFVGNYNLTILDEAEVCIGNNVFIGPNTGIYTVEHAFDAAQRSEGIMKARPVTIGNDVWICANTIILPGVTIGDGAVVGAGSVVRHDIPPHTFAAGNPCRTIRAITAVVKGTEIIV